MYAQLHKPNIINKEFEGIKDYTNEDVFTRYIIIIYNFLFIKI